MFIQLVKLMLYVSLYSSSQSLAENTSFRITLPFASRKSFSSQFVPRENLLKVRVKPASAEEFDTALFYDSKLVHRVVLSEKMEEVFLSLYLRDQNIKWYLAEQEAPWRIVIDLWEQSETKKTQDNSVSWKTQVAQTNYDNFDSNLKPVLPVKSPNAAPIADGGTTLEKETLPETSKKFESTDRQPNLMEQQISSRIENINPVSIETFKKLEYEIGHSVGSQNEWQALNQYVIALYSSGKNPLPIIRKLVINSERKFREDPRLLWIAGESSFLEKKYDLSKDYLRTLLSDHDKSSFAQLAKIRLTDMEEIRKSSLIETGILSNSSITTYKDILNKEVTPLEAKIAALMRIYLFSIDKEQESAKIYLPILDDCVNKNVSPIETRKNCFYVRTRYKIEALDLIGSDQEVQKFMQFASGDKRAITLSDLVTSSAKKFLENSFKSNSSETWITFEDKARPQLLEFTIKEPKYLKMRSELLLKAGNKKSAATLLSIYADRTKDSSEKTYSLALSSRLLLESKESRRAEQVLSNLREEVSASGKGISSEGIANLMAIALPPYKNLKAHSLIMDELKAGRYIETDFKRFVELLKLAKSNSDKDWLYQRLIGFPVKSQSETLEVQQISLKRAETLRETNRLKDSAELYLAIAKLNGGTKMAEAAYKAGLVFARLGMLEKSKESWQLAVSDQKDKRYSDLAAERLDRMK